MRAVNFCAGPCTLPVEVLEEAQREFVDFAGSGMSLLEMSHRSDEYDQVHRDTLRLAAEVIDAPPDFEVLLLQGGASLQFAMVPLNLLGDGASAGYVVSGAWGSKAFGDARHHGDVYAAWDGKPTGYTTMPDPDAITVRADSRYLHVTTNETIDGIRLTEWPNTEVPLVADASSDYMTRRLPWDRLDVVYGGAQKNLGPAGATLVFVRRSILDATNHDQASYLRYDLHAAKDSLYNTPPVFAIWMMGKVLAWMKTQGGLDQMERLAAERAGRLYAAIEESDGYYHSPVSSRHRSLMNVVFRLPTEDLEAHFVKLAADRGLVNLRGHRSVGGIRASLYNAMPLSGVDALVGLMTEFRGT